jgi:hypothetical protein
LIGGFEGFLIFDPDMAREVYGEWNVQKQIEELCPPEVVEVVKQSPVWQMAETPEDQLEKCWKTGGPRTGPMAHAFFSALRGEMMRPEELTEFQRRRGAHQFKETLLIQTKIKGYIFQGENDGYVCFVRDFKSIVPVAYRTQDGNWHDALTEKNFNKIASSSDAAYSFGGKYPETNPNEKAIDGFIVVKKDGKYNYVNIANGEELLPVWADTAYAFDANEHEGRFVIGGNEFTTNGKFFSDDDGFSYDKNEFIDELHDRGLMEESKVNKKPTLLESFNDMLGRMNNLNW